MIVVCKPESDFCKLLGKAAPARGKNYALHALCMTTAAGDGGYLLANLLTREILYLTKEEYDLLAQPSDLSSDVIRYLIQNHFLTEDSFDPYFEVDEYRKLKKFLKRQSGKFSFFKILPTLDCNARCFYCYQRERYHALSMDKVTVEATSNFILNNSLPDKTVELQWHGGEPLYHMEAIDAISAALANAGRRYTAVMISNGYLFDDAVVEKAKSLWRLTRVQITLDGTETVYNRAKAYIYRDGQSPYYRVLDNIERLLAAGMEVIIRVNVDMYNKDDIFRMLDEIAPRFSVYPNVRIYAYGLYDDSTHRVKTKDDRMDVYGVIEEFYAACKAHGLTAAGKYRAKIRLNRCMADTDGAIVIFPSGKIGKCDHVPEANTIGTVFDGVTDQEEAAAWAVKSNLAKDCKGCALYADCYRLEKCLDDGPKACDAAYRSYHGLQMKTRILEQYENYKNAQKKTAE